MSSMTYRPDIDGLRAIAVLAVVVHHLSPSLLPGGYVGVDIFFVISGYLITKIIDREISDGTFTYLNFYERRARRIFPALFSVLIATFIAGYFIFLPSDLVSTLKATIGTVFFSSNFVFWREMKQGYFAATDIGLNPLLHTWSLAVEEQFYVFFPILLFFCAKYFPKYTKNILILTALISLAASAVLIRSCSVAVFFLSPFRIWELLAGSVLAINTIPQIRDRMARELFAILGLALILAACIFYTPKTTFPGVAALAPVLGAAVLIHSGTGGNSFVLRMITIKPMIFVGTISYSLYLWHWPIIVFIKYKFGIDFFQDLLIPVAAASFGVAYLSFRFIEQPFRSKSEVFSGPRIFGSSAVCAAILLLMSITGLIQSGYSRRFPQEVAKLDQDRQPFIPYKSCDGKSLGSWCRIGKPDAEASIFLWGDSHLLALAPALNKIFEDKGVNAILAVRSACPPLLGVASKRRPDCEMRNKVIKKFIADNSKIQTVVMAGFWSTYFKSESSLILAENSAPVTRKSPAQQALKTTLDWLESTRKRVVVIGPIPVHQENVPFALALEVAIGRDFPKATFIDQKKLHSDFYEAVEFKSRGAQLTFLDPIDWLCTATCTTSVGATAAYRDAHHLSVAGSMLLVDQLSVGIFR